MRPAPEWFFCAEVCGGEGVDPQEAGRPGDARASRILLVSVRTEQRPIPLVLTGGAPQRLPASLLAATNRPEILDSALLRVGRFDRQMLVDDPDRVGRSAILEIHLRKVELAPDVDAEGGRRPQRARPRGPKRDPRMTEYHRRESAPCPITARPIAPAAVTYPS
jgi:hypothetical protein